jgi:hypothetical protein
MPELVRKLRNYGRLSSLVSLPLQLGYAVTYLTNLRNAWFPTRKYSIFELSDDEMSQLTALNRPTGLGLPNPNDQSRSSSPLFNSPEQIKNTLKC